MAGTILTGGPNANGVGYAVGDTGVINQSGNTSATYIVTAIGGDTELAGVTITNGGSGYVVASNVTMTPGGAQPGSGSGGTYNIASVSGGGGGGSGYINHVFGGGSK